MNSQPAFLSSAVAERAMPGEYRSGDLSVVVPVVGGALVAVIDGLGHGMEAAAAATAARDTVRSCAGEPIEVVLEQCHNALRGTRGAVITLAQVDQQRDELTWIGVGNVEGRIWPALPGATLNRQAPPLRGGVVGHALPKLRSSTLTLSRGDLLILSTDGVSNNFHEEFMLNGPVQQIADDIMDKHWTGKDDALILVARYLG
ncbi:MAG TPA: SpoIIE family protein phosphatase [Actinomycetota bacterium]|nr:SpoIIE family protein phosphatase [Actinomycetota bacterium]